MKISRLLMVTIAITATACSQTENSVTAAPDALGPGDVASVDGSRVPESVFRLYSQGALQRDADQLSDTERDSVIDQLIQIRLLADAAIASGLPDERVIAAQLHIQRSQLLAREAVSRYLEDNPPTETELRGAYERAVVGLGDIEYHTRHILVASEEEAQEVIALLDAGGDFAELAQEYSTGPTGPNGGDLEWITPDTVVAPFAEAMQTIAVNTYSTAPVQTQFGWHVIFVEETREQQPPGLEAMRAEITTQVEQQKLENYIEQLRNAAIVEIY